LEDKMNFKNLKEKQGITLIALIITIIVLLILAGISIAMLAGDNGILTRAKSAKKTSEIEGIKEEIKTEIIAEQAGNEGNISKSDLKTILEKYGTINKDEDGETIKSITTKKDGYEIAMKDIWTGTATKTATKIASKTESYVGYYADIDGDEKVDGVIYADLAVGGSGAWKGNNGSSYEYSKVTEDLKSYYVSSDSYTGFGDKWTKPVLTVIDGSGTEDRFYVMALEDFNTGTTYRWYSNAMGKLDNTIESSVNDFGQGKTNTTTMIEEWNKGKSGKYGAQNKKDMWGGIQGKTVNDSGEVIKDENETDYYNQGWFVPSKSEWLAFGDMTYTKMGVTTDKYANYGLKGMYWSSTQHDSSYAYYVSCSYGGISLDRVDYNYCFVRLSATF